MSRRDILQSQLFSTMGHLLRCHAEIVSGSYKKRKLERGCGYDDEQGIILFRPMTDDEKLDHMMAQMKSHERIVQEINNEIEKEG